MSDDLVALVIEDDFDASVIFAKALEVLGFQTEVIDSGEKALERLKAVVPVIVLLDLHLPEVMGTSIIRTIRADERLKETLVIIASADPRSADLVQDMADLVLIKPTTFSQVRDLAGRLTAPRRKKRAAEMAAKAAAAAPAAEPAAPVAASAAPVTEPAAPKEEASADPAGLAASRAKTIKVPSLDEEPTAADEEPTAVDKGPTVADKESTAADKEPTGASDPPPAKESDQA
jgi:DNA-binding response OmpR family regulator